MPPTVQNILRFFLWLWVIGATVGYLIQFRHFIVPLQALIFG